MMSNQTSTPGCSIFVNAGRFAHARGCSQHGDTANRVRSAACAIYPGRIALGDTAGLSASPPGVTAALARPAAAAGRSARALAGGAPHGNRQISTGQGLVARPTSFIHPGAHDRQSHDWPFGKLSAPAQIEEDCSNPAVLLLPKSASRMRVAVSSRAAARARGPEGLPHSRNPRLQSRGCWPSCQQAQRRSAAHEAGKL